jgi:dihydropteroate synthase
MFTLNCRGRLLTLEEPVVMGILNTTPDSFYEGSRFATEETLLQKAAEMIAEGATLLDVGGQSTRPGAQLLTAEEEAARVIPALHLLRKHFPEVFLSTDTFYSEVARRAADAGADIINDISGGTADTRMIQTMVELKMPYVAMHMKGMPQNMQDLAVYQDVTEEVLRYFIQRLGIFAEAGLYDVIVDPGFGFAKTAVHNFRLLKQLENFRVLQRPLLVGLSRKSTIYKTLGTTAAEALNGTTVLHTIALQKGAHILRVHDVKEACEAIRLLQALNQA